MNKKAKLLVVSGLSAFVLLSFAAVHAAQSNLPRGYEKIPSPKEISLYKDIKKVGTALWGIRKSPVLPVKDLKQKLANEKVIKKFSSTDEIKKFLSKKVGDSSSYYPKGMRTLALGDVASVDSWGMEGVAEESKNAAAGDGMSAPVADDYSKTNVQVAGVDEADIVKTDGRYAYAVADNDVYIIDAYPGDKAEIVSKIEFKDRPQDLYVNGNSLIVFGADNNINANPTFRSFRRQSSFTFFKVFDMSDKKNPKLLRDLSYEGSYYNSRMIGDHVYLLVSNHIYNYFYNSEIVVPRAFNKGKEIRFCEGGVRCPPVYYFDMPYDSYNFVNVVAINVRDNSQNPANDVYLLSGSQSIFASEKNLYITYTKYLSEDDLLVESLKELIYAKLPEEYRTRINKIEAADEQVLNLEEKTRKILAILSWYGNTLPSAEQEKFNEDLVARMKAKYKAIAPELEKTVIHKIAIDRDKLEYKAVGEVAGQVLNQYSMDEKDGYFRVATTRSRTWSQYADEADQESYSNLFVLDGSLKLVGAVERLARGENIHSVRFMGDRAYMVTFKQIDPLFVLDLRDPKKPAVAGQLKIPGYSNYLHPYDENTLIGLGKETEEKDGRVTNGGIKLSLFDVSDIANPKEVDKYVMGESGSYSIAESEPKAFLFSLSKNLLVIPVSVYEKGVAAYPQFAFGGAAVFSVDKNGFKLRAKIDHSDGGVLGTGEPWRGYGHYDSTVNRSLYIQDSLYTFSSRYMQVNKLDTLGEVKKLELKKGGDDYKVIN